MEWDSKKEPRVKIRTKHVSLPNSNLGSSRPPHTFLALSIK